MMANFKTYSGTDYYITEDHKFWGGPIKTPTLINTAKVVVGERAKIKLVDGRSVNTSAVQALFAGMSDNPVSFLTI